jgi:hypothetical protein
LTSHPALVVTRASVYLWNQEESSVRHRSTLSRWLAPLAGLTIIAVSGFTSPALAGNTRTVSVGSSADGQLPNVTVSAGESIIFPLTIENRGRQTLNNVAMVVGRDGLPLVERNPQTAIVPQAPIDLPDGVTITDSETGGGVCTPGRTLTCLVGTLGARDSFSITVTITSTRDALPMVMPTKAVVTVAEIANDQGSNTDTFAAEGSVNLLAYSCDSIAAYRTQDQSKVVSTCPVTDPDDANGQSATIVMPSHLQAIGLTDNIAQACPAALGTCYGSAAVEANVEGDDASDTIVWVIDVELAPGASVNVLKVVVYHEDDLGNQTLIALTKKNACKTDSQTNCGVAQIVDIDGTSVLRVTFQTAGNGKARV